MSEHINITWSFLLIIIAWFSVRRGLGNRNTGCSFIKRRILRAAIIIMRLITDRERP